MNRGSRVGGGQREEEMAIEDGGGWRRSPHPSFREGTTSVSLCIFWHKAELTSRRKWWRSSLVHGAFNGLILRPNFISFSETFSPFFNYPAHFARPTFNRNSCHQLSICHHPTTLSELQM